MTCLILSSKVYILRLNFNLLAEETEVAEGFKNTGYYIMTCYI